jgi:hypothetical protein
MNGRERIMAALRGEETDRLCWSPLIDQYFTSSLPEQGYEEIDSPAVFRLIGGDVIERHCPSIQRQEDSTIVRQVVENADTHLEIIETPVGTLRIEQHYSESAKSSYIKKHPLNTIEDVKVYEYILEHTQYKEDFNAFLEQDQIIGIDGIATSDGPMSPIQEFFQTLCGIENTYYLLWNHPREINACFDLMHEKNKQAYRLTCEGPLEVVIDYEDTSSTVISPKYFQKYCAPFLKEYADICHDAGKLFITHMCGKLSAFGDQIWDGCQDGIDSVCPPTSGDIWSHEARETWDSGKIIIGGIEPSKLARMSVDETRKYATQVLDQMPNFRRFILSTGCATAYGTPVGNLQAVTDIVANYAWK